MGRLSIMYCVLLCVYMWMWPARIGQWRYYAVAGIPARTLQARGPLLAGGSRAIVRYIPTHGHQCLSGHAQRDSVPASAIDVPPGSNHTGTFRASPAHPSYATHTYV